MLTKSTLAASAGLAQLLSERGLFLKVKPNTPLAELVETSTLYQNIQDSAAPGTLANPGSVVDNLEASANEIQPGQFSHDDAMEKAVSTVSMSVTRSLDLARNVVSPMITEVVKQTQAFMDEKAQSTLAPYYIVPMGYAPLYDSALLLDLVSRYGDTPTKDVRLIDKPIPLNGSVLDLLAQGQSSLDQAARALAEKLGEQEVMAIYQSAFGATRGELLPLIRPNNQSANSALFIFLFASRLLEQIPDGLNMDLESYRAYMASIKAQAGRAICQVVEARNVEAKLRRLIVQYPQSETGGAIQVNADVYSQFLAEGGTPEAVMGAAISDRQLSYRVLLEKKAEYERAWERAYAMLQSKLSFVRFDSLREGLRLAMLAQISTLDPTEVFLGIQVNDVDGFRGHLRAALQVRLTHVKVKDVEDLWHVARKAVCRVIFAHTDAERILNAIDASAKAHPELDIREAALLATVDYICQWVGELIDVSSHPGV